MPYISLTKNVSQEAFLYIRDNWVKGSGLDQNEENSLEEPSLAEKIQAIFLREVASRVCYALLIPITFVAAVLDITIGSVAGLISLISFGCLFDEIATNHLKSSGILIGGPVELFLRIVRPSVEEPVLRGIVRKTVEDFFDARFTEEATSSKTVYRLVLTVRLPLIALAMTVDALISIIALPVMFLTVGYFKPLNEIVLGGLGFPEILLDTFQSLKHIQKGEPSLTESEEFGDPLGE